MSTETRLKPCPFCGGAAKEYERFNANVITCRKCGVQVRQSEMGQGDAADRWNKRSAPVSAEPVAWQYFSTVYKEWCPASPDRLDVLRRAGHQIRPLYAAPVSAQAQPTQLGYTLSDVHEAYSRGKADAQTQQPVSGADGLPTERVLIDGTAYELPSAVAAELLRLHLEILEAEQAQAQPLAPQDAPDGAMERALTELVDKIVPRLDTGDLLADAATASKALDSAQQDADKVDAERYRLIRAKVYASNATGRKSWSFHYDNLPTPLSNPMKGSVAGHFDDAIDAARKEPDQ